MQYYSAFRGAAVEGELLEILSGGGREGGMTVI